MYKSNKINEPAIYVSPAVRSVAIGSAQAILNSSITGGDGMLQSMNKVDSFSWDE